MEKKAALFDLDGVILDTEGLYTRFWGQQGEWAHPELKDFSSRIKGHTLKQIFEEYFPRKADQEELSRRINEFESKMPFQYIPGAFAFIKSLKEAKVPVAIVTSSDETKMRNVYQKRPELKELFDVIITADKITRSKPDPECYLLAAKELNRKPEDCFVFEDSFSGLEAGRNAGMTVIGLATTHPADHIENKADWVIPDFRNFTDTKLMELCLQLQIR